MFSLGLLIFNLLCVGLTLVFFFTLKPWKNVDGKRKRRALVFIPLFMSQIVMMLNLGARDAFYEIISLAFAFTGLSLMAWILAINIFEAEA